MTYNWGQFLELAQYLRENKPVSPETSFRNAVSRSYFAAFNHAKDYAIDNFSFAPTNTADDHGKLKAILKKTRIRWVVQKLDDIRQFRNLCDYNGEEIDNLETMAGDAIDNAKSIVERL